MNVFILFLISFLSWGVALAANPFEPGSVELAVAGLSVFGLFSWHMVKYHHGHTSSTAEHLLDTIESNFTSSWALKPTITTTQAPTTTTVTVISYVTKEVTFPMDEPSNKIARDSTSNVVTERILLANKAVKDLFHNGITFVRTFIVEPACHEIFRVCKQATKGPLLKSSIFLINLLRALNWTLGKAIFRAVLFVDYCIIIFGTIKVYAYLSLACKNVTGLSLFDVLKLLMTIIFPRRAGRVSAATQTEDASPPATPPTVPAPASLAPRAPPKPTVEDADDGDDVSPPANSPTTSNVVVLRPIIRVPNEGTSIFVDRRRAMPRRVRFATGQDAAGSSPGPASVASGLGKRGSRSFEEQSTRAEDGPAVARPGRTILAPHVRGAGTEKCPLPQGSFPGLLAAEDDSTPTILPKRVRRTEDDGTTVPVEQEDQTTTEEEQEVDMEVDDGFSEGSSDLEIITEDPMDVESAPALALPVPVPASSSVVLQVQQTTPTTTSTVQDASTGTDEGMGGGMVVVAAPSAPIVLTEEEEDFAPPGFGEEE